MSIPIEWEEPSSGQSGGGQQGGGVWGAINAGFSEQAVGSMASEAKEMLDSAKSGGFRVSPEAAEPIMDVLEEMMERVQDLSNELTVIGAQEPLLGNHDYGKRVAAHQQQAFAVEDGSPTVVLRQLYTVLDDSHAALKIAMEKYGASESSASDAFKGQA